MLKKYMLLILVIIFSFMMNADEKKKEEKNKKINDTLKKILKKVDFQLGLQTSPFRANDLLLKFHGDKKLIKQYAVYNSGTIISSDFSEEQSKFSSSYIFIPFEINVHVYEKFYFKLGYECSGKKTVSLASQAKVSQSGWSNINFKNSYDISLKASWVHFGVEYRHNDKLASYLNILAGSAKVDAVEEHISFDESGYKENIKNSYDLSGSGMGLALGGKYYYSFGKKGYLKERMRLFAKIEIFISNIGELKGKVTRKISNSLGESFSETVKGSLYKVEKNPVSLGWVETAEISPKGSDYRNAQKIGLNFSGIRLGIGVRF